MIELLGQSEIEAERELAIKAAQAIPEPEQRALALREYISINGGPPEKMFDIPSEWGGLRDDGWSEETLSWGN